MQLARINSGYANVTAPIPGAPASSRLPRARSVGQSEATLFTTIEQIDPIYVNFSQAVADLDRLRRAQTSGHVQLAEQNKAQVELTLPDGSRIRPLGHA